MKTRFDNLPTIDPYARDPMRDVVAYFSGRCCCKAEMLVLAHGKTITSSGPGTLSRLSPTTGEVIWTVDFGTYSNGGIDYDKTCYSCDLDSEGNVYAYWAPAAPGSGYYTPLYLGGTPHGVRKFDKNGLLLHSYDFPAMKTPYPSLPSLYPYHPRVRVDPANDDLVYCGCAVDFGEKFLYQFDASLSPQWTFGRSDTVSAFPFAGISGSPVSMAFPDGGGVYVAVQGATLRISQSGGLVDYDLISYGDAAGVFLNSSQKVRVSLQSSVYVIAGYGTFPTVNFSRYVAEFPTPEISGTWYADPSGYICDKGWANGTSEIYVAGLRPPTWSTSGGATRWASFFVTDASGAVKYASEFGSGLGAHGSGVIFGLCRTPIVGGYGAGAYGAGTVRSVDPETGADAAGPVFKLNETGTAVETVWAKRIAAPGQAVRFGFDVAARIV